MKAIPLKYFRYLRLILNFLCLIGLGALNELLGPTLPDLSIRVSTNYEEIGRTLSLRLIGNAITPSLAGLLYDRFPRSREFGIGIVIALTGAFGIAIPYCRSVAALSVIFVLQGFCSGGTATAGQSMIIELFGAGAVSALQFQHLGWGVGTFLANFILRPFLAPNLKLSKKQINYPCLANVTGVNTSDINGTAASLDNTGSRIEYAYIIIGTYAVIIGITAFLFAFLPKPELPPASAAIAKSKKSLRQMIGPSAVSDGKPLFGAFMLLALPLIYILDIGAYGTYSSYQVTVAIDPCKGFQMSQSDATLLQGIRAGVFSCSRVLIGIVMAVLVARNIHPGFLLTTYFTGQVISFVILTTFGLKYEIVYWIANCCCAFFHAPTYGGVTPWFNLYIHVTSTVISTAVTGSTLGKFVVTWISGYLLRQHSSQVFLNFVCALLIVLIAVVFSVLFFSVRIGMRAGMMNRRRREPIKNKNAEEDKEEMVSLKDT